MNLLGESQSCKPKWYFTKEEIEEHTPSRRDGISHEQEYNILQFYCSHLQQLGMKLNLPQVTIATAILLCHRFFMHQSHAKNHWQNVANSCMFLACKVKDTTRWLKDVIVVAYKLVYCWDPSASKRIRQQEVYEKEKKLILMGEKLVLATVAFDLNIEDPYKPLVVALKSMKMPQNGVAKVAWNFVNDCLCTTLCLQYKPHYIAAGSIFLSAKVRKIKLPSTNGKVWWMQFDVSPRQLEEVIQDMLQMLRQSHKQASQEPCKARTEIQTVAVKRKHVSTESSISTELVEDSKKYIIAKTTHEPTVDICNQRNPNCDGDANNTALRNENSLITDSGSADSVVEDGGGELTVEVSNENTGCKIVSMKESKVDITGIRERLKRRKIDRAESKKPVNGFDIEINSETWIEQELEKSIELMS